MLLVSFVFRDDGDLDEVQHSLENLLKELEQIRATLTVPLDVRTEIYAFEYFYR